MWSRSFIYTSSNIRYTQFMAAVLVQLRDLEVDISDLGIQRSLAALEKRKCVILDRDEDGEITCASTTYLGTTEANELERMGVIPLYAWSEDEYMP